MTRNVDTAVLAALEADSSGLIPATGDGFCAASIQEVIRITNFGSAEAVGNYVVVAWRNPQGYQSFTMLVKANAWTLQFPDGGTEPPGFIVGDVIALGNWIPVAQNAPSVDLSANYNRGCMLTQKLEFMPPSPTAATRHSKVASSPFRFTSFQLPTRSRTDSPAPAFRGSPGRGGTSRCPPAKGCVSSQSTAPPTSTSFGTWRRTASRRRETPS